MSEQFSEIHGVLEQLRHYQKIVSKIINRWGNQSPRRLARRQKWSKRMDKFDSFLDDTGGLF